MNIKTCKYKIDFASFTASLDHRGRITVPASIRKRMSISFDSIVLIDIKRGERYDR